MRPTKFFFGRLHVIGQYDDKRDMLAAGLATKKTRPSRKHIWGFFDVTQLEADGAPLSGLLVKLAPEQAEEVGDLVTHKMGSVTVPNAAVATSRFFLDVPTGLIAFQYVAGHVDATMFIEQFCRLFEEGLNAFFVSADIQLVEDRLEFVKTLKLFERVDRIDIHLHPTNPHNDEWYRRVDERLKALEAAKYRESFEADRGGPGLRVADDPEVLGKVVMAEDGYGEVSASGLREGRPTTISTKENPVSASVAIGDITLNEIFSFLGETFDAIKRRINQ